MLRIASAVGRARAVGSRVRALPARLVLSRSLSSAEEPGLKGAHLNKKTGKWTSRLMVKGQSMHLGTFDTAREAHEAYEAARAVYGSKKGKPGRSPFRPVKQFEGVVLDRDTGLFEAVVVTERVNEDGVKEELEVSGGEYKTAEEAARAYDALARMYFGADAKTNFPLSADYSGWVPPETQERRQHLAVKPGVPLTVTEVVHALEAERGVDVKVIAMGGRSEIAENLVFVTGKSPAHMRRMGDMLVKAVVKRELPERPDIGPWCVENRSGDDWMVVDLGDVVVNIFDATARTAYGLEAKYERVARGEDFDALDSIHHSDDYGEALELDGAGDDDDDDDDDDGEEDGGGGVGSGEESDEGSRGAAAVTAAKAAITARGAGASFTSSPRSSSKASVTVRTKKTPSKTASGGASAPRRKDRTPPRPSYLDEDVDEGEHDEDVGLEEEPLTPIQGLSGRSRASAMSAQKAARFEKWLEKNPIPDTWHRRLDRDEEAREQGKRAASGELFAAAVDSGASSSTTSDGKGKRPSRD